MSSNMNSDKNIPPDSEAHYEELACQEEIYLEETEEELRVILTSDDPPPSLTTAEYSQSIRGEREIDCEVNRSMADAKNNPRMAESPDEPLVDAAEKLITGDSDDPPLSEEEVVETLRMTSNARKLGQR